MCFQEEIEVVGEQAEQQGTEETSTQETGEEEITPEEESQDVVVVGSDEDQVCVNTDEVFLKRQHVCITWIIIVDESPKRVVLPFCVLNFRNHKNMKREDQNMTTKEMMARNIWRTIRNAEMKTNMPMKTRANIRYIDCSQYNLLSLFPLASDMF